MRPTFAVFLISGALVPFAALAADPPCRQGLAEVHVQLREKPVPQTTDTQIKALLEQATRACNDNNDVVASAAIDQIKAILKGTVSG
jgi:hypothetical protein